MVDFWDPYGEPPEPPDHFDFMEDCEIEDDGLPALLGPASSILWPLRSTPSIMAGLCKRYTMDEPF